MVGVSLPATAEPLGKVYVCKYVGTPGVSERLQTGQNPIEVSINAIKDYNGVGSYFNDAHGEKFLQASRLRCLRSQSQQQATAPATFHQSFHQSKPPVTPVPPKTPVAPNLPRDTGGGAQAAPQASFIGPCGDPRIKAVFDNSDSINAPVTFIWSYVRGKDNQRWWGSKTVAPGKVFTTKWHWVRGYTLATIEAVGIGPLVGTMVTKGQPWGTGACQK